ncbi:MAG: transposase [Mediterraneibacter faecis]
MDYFDLDPDRIPSQSAFNQRGLKFLFPLLSISFSEFSSAFPSTTNTFKGHCILACDGCHVVYTTNSEIIEDFNKPTLLIIKVVTICILIASLMLLVRLLLTLLYNRVKSLMNVRLSTSLDHFQPDEQDEFDVTIKRFLTDKKTNIMRSQSDVYRYMNPSKNIPHFQQLLNHKHLYFMQFRVIKMKVAEDSYEYIITNLPYSFDLEDLKICYHWRWQMEVAFRYLKHANGLLYFHSKKPEYLKQEIYANLILYNFGVFLANEAIQENQKKKHRITNKYQYEVDFSSALKISRKYFIRGRSSENRIIKLIAKYIHAVKSEFRQFSRPLRGIGAIHFGYR